MLLCLGSLLDAGIVERRWDLPDSSAWALTLAGVRGLEIGFAVKVGTDGNQVLTHPQGSVDQSWTLFEMLHALLGDGWQMQLLDRKTPRARVLHYSKDGGAKVIWFRQSTQSLSRLYLMCLLHAYVGTLAPSAPVEHLRENQYYKSLLNILQTKKGPRQPEAA
jgi:hypothetical protein